ncbi:MAG: DUF3107 domain-containing protein [Microbacteriaceae bacterium]|nr:DUF3107 domain-containing protein [Cryobacterium sp.]MBX3104162.1 DUF3107 domain-containing protein [Cryobacterium sp.]MCC6375757.1 DUF3107 domain-containing protein [Microbacteriaceae bacterium]
MEIRIGIINNARELNFETERSAAEVEKLISDALHNESKLIKFEDAKGDIFLVPIASVAYIELGSGVTRRIGFVA